MMSGAMIRSISSRVLVRSQVGITPSVSPLCGSVSISGIGMKGAFAGSNQRASPEGGGTTGAAGTASTAGTGADSSARAPVPASSASAQAAAHRPGAWRHGTGALASARRVPAIGSLDTGGAARTGDVPGDGWGRRQWGSECAAGVGVTLVGEVVAEHGNFPGLRATREGDAGVGGPVGALEVEVVDDIELDLVLPGIVRPQQQIPHRRRDLVGAGEQGLHARGLVEGVAREVLHRPARKGCVQETLVARIGPAECSLERGARREAPQCLELGAADARTAGIGDEGDRRAVRVQSREQALHLVVLAVEHIAVDGECSAEQVGFQTQLVVRQLLRAEWLILERRERRVPATGALAAADAEVEIELRAEAVAARQLPRPEAIADTLVDRRTGAGDLERRRGRGVGGGAGFGGARGEHE